MDTRAWLDCCVMIIAGRHSWCTDRHSVLLQSLKLSQHLSCVERGKILRLLSKRSILKYPYMSQPRHPRFLGRG